MSGCCADKACNAETCMTLPAGKTCADCMHVKRCLAFGFTPSADSDECDFFPRRFGEKPLPSPEGGGRR